MLRAILLAATSSGAASSPPLASSVAAPRVTQYFAGWGIYSYPNPSRTSSRQAFYPWQMHLASITHINYAFLDVDWSCSVKSMDPWADFDKSFAGLPLCSGAVTAACVPQSVKSCAYGGNVGALRCLRDKDHPHLKLVFSLGGWTKSTYFSGCAKTAAKRAKLVSNAVARMTEHDFDGIDVDWEYPVCCGEAGNEIDPADWDNYLLLLHEMRAALDAAHPSTHKEMSIAMGMSPKVSGVAPRERLAAALDVIYLMTYDYNGAWSMQTGHNAPLFGDPAAKGLLPENYNIDWGVSLWRSDVPASKLVLGLPAYGRAWVGVDTEYGIGSDAHPGTYEAGLVSWYDTKARYYALADRKWNNVSKVPYYAANGKFISYDDPASIAAKAKYAQSRGMAGMMWWEASDDPQADLLNAANSAWEAAATATPPSPPPPPSPPSSARVASSPSLNMHSSETGPLR